jgi:hypothetical protein
MNEKEKRRRRREKRMMRIMLGKFKLSLVMCSIMKW